MTLFYFWVIGILDGGRPVRDTEVVVAHTEAQATELVKKTLTGTEFTFELSMTEPLTSPMTIIQYERKEGVK